VVCGVLSLRHFRLASGRVNQLCALSRAREGGPLGQRFRSGGAGSELSGRQQHDPIETAGRGGLQDICQNLDPVAKPGRGLNYPRVLELSFVAADNLAHRRARYRQRAHDLLDGAMLLKIGASYQADKVHANHPQKPFPAPQGQKEGR